MNRLLPRAPRLLVRATLVGAVAVGGGQLAALPAAAAGPITTDTTLSASPAGPVARESTVLTATVTAASGPDAPAGTVDFYYLGANGAVGGGDDVLVESGTLPAGSAGVASVSTTVPVTNPTASTRRYDARYVPADAAVHAADSSAALDVTSTTRALDVAVVVTAPDPATVGSTSTVTATATDHGTGAGVDASAASLSIGGAAITLGSWSNGVATGSFAPAAGTSGTRNVVLSSFTPTDAGVYAAPTLTTPTVRVVEGTTTGLTVSNAAPLARDEVTLTAKVDGTGTAALDGTLRILELGADHLVGGGDDTVVASEVVPATPVVTTRTLTQQVSFDTATTARYAATFTNRVTTPADRTHADSASAVRTVAATRRAVTATATAAAEPAGIGQPVQVTVTATDTATAADPTPHQVAPGPGQSTLTIGSRSVPLTWTAGVGTGTYTPAAADGTGTFDVMLVLAGTGSYTGPAGPIGTVRVVQGTTTTLDPTYPATDPTPLAKDAVTLTAKVLGTGTTALDGVLAIEAPGPDGLFDTADDVTVKSETILPASNLTTRTISESVSATTATTAAYRARFAPSGTAATRTHNPSSADLTFASHRRPTTAVVTFSPARLAIGRASTITVTATDTTAPTTHTVTPAPGSGDVLVGAVRVPLTWTNGVGTGSYTPLAGTAIGATSVQVDYAASDAYADPAAAPDVRVVDATTTALDRSTASVRAKEAAAFTATVTATTGSTTPTGTVELLDATDTVVDTATLTGSGTSATAVLHVTAATTGARVYHARYVPAGTAGGSDVHAASESATATVTSTPRPYDVDVVIGTPGVIGVASAVTVTPTDPNASSITGWSAADGTTVTAGSTTLTIGGHPVALTWTDGIGTGSYTPAAADGTGNQTVSFSFTPAATGVYAASPGGTVPATLHVVDATTTALDRSTASVRAKEAAAFTATVTATTGTATPTGTVELLDATDTVVDTATLTGSGTSATAVLHVTAATTGARVYHARYVPAGTPSTTAHAASESATATVTSTPRPYIVDVTIATPNPGEIDDTSEVTVTPTDPNASSITGWSAADGTTVAHGSGTSLSIDGHPVTLTWTDGIGTGSYTPAAADGTGDKTVTFSFAPATADVYAAVPTVTVPATFRVVDATATTLAADDTAPRVEDDVTLTATVTATTGTGTPAGTVEFLDPSGTVVGTGALAATAATGDQAATATATVTPLDVLPRVYTARYVPAGSTDGTADHGASVSTGGPASTVTGVLRTATVSVAPPATDPEIDVLTAIDVTAVDGQRSAKTVHGTATVTAGGVALGTKTLSGGTASFPYTPGSVGPQTIKVTVDLRGDNGVASYETTTVGDTSTTVRRRQHPTVTADPAGAVTAGQTVTLSTTGEHGAVSVARASTTPTDRCTISGLSVTVVRAPSCGLEVTAAGTNAPDWYFPETVGLTLTVNAQPVTAVATVHAASSVYGDEITVSATAKAGSTDLGGTGVVSWIRRGAAESTRVTVGTYTYQGSPLVISRAVTATTGPLPLDVDDYVVQVTYVPSTSDTGVYATTADTDDLTVTPAPQAITTATVPVLRNVDDAYVPAASGGRSGNTVQLSVDTPTVCDVDPLQAGRIVFTAVGTCRLLFDQAGSLNYQAAPQHEVEFTVDPTKVALSGTPPTTTATFPTYEDAVAVGLSAESSRVTGRPVVGTTTWTVARTTSTTVPEVVPQGALASTTPASSASLEFGAKQLVRGTYEVTFTFTPTDQVNWTTETLVVPFTVKVAPQAPVLSTTVRPQPEPAEVSTTWRPAFETTRSGLPVTITADVPASVPETLLDYAQIPAASVPTSTCRIKPTTTDRVEFLAQGTCYVDATVAPSPDRYAGGTLRTAVNVKRIVSRLALALPPGAPVTGAGLSVSVAAQYGPLGSPLTVPGHGDFAVTVTTPTSSGELAETSTLSDTAEWFGGRRFVTFPATHAGTYAVTASFFPTDPVVFTPVPALVAPATSFVVGKAAQTVAQTGRPSARKVHEDWTTSPTGGASGRPVRLVVDTASAAVCAADGAVLRFNAAGTCTYSFAQDGTDDYLAGASPSYSIEVSRTITDLTVAAPATARVGSPTVVTLTPVGGGRAVPGSAVVTVTDENGDSAVTPGSATLTWANGVGTFRFLPSFASPADQPFVVTATFTPTDTAAYTAPTGLAGLHVDGGLQSIVVADDRVPPTGGTLTAFVNDTWTPGETPGGNPDGIVHTSLDASDAGACTRDPAGKITFTAPGTCRVTMTMDRIAGSTPGSPNTWEAAPSRSWSIEVSSHPVTLALQDVPEASLVYGADVPVVVKVTGTRAGGLERVDGKVTFTVDGVDAGTVSVDPAGEAAQKLRFVRAPGESASDVHDVVATFVPTNVPVAHLWAARTMPWKLTVRRVAQRIETDPDRPTTMAVGQTWTPVLTSKPAGFPVVVGAGPDTVCTANGTAVTMVGSATGAETCQVTYSVAGDRIYAPIEIDGPQIASALRDATVSVTADPADVGAPVDVVAHVEVPASPAIGTPGAGLTTAPAEVATGTVTFRFADAAGTVVTGVPLVDGTATRAYTPVSADAVAVSAEYVPAHAERHAAGVRGTTTLAVDPVGTITGVPVVTSSSVSATITRDRPITAPINGRVDFSWYPVGQPTDVHDLGHADVHDDVATVTGRVPPADQPVVILADYAGGTDHAPSKREYERLLPTIDASADRPLTGWNDGPVTVSFVCHAANAALVGDCPAPQVFGRDGGGQRATATIVATDGGTASVALGGIKVDRTAPTVQITGLKSTPYAGEGPTVGCTTSDELTESTCRITTDPATVPGDYDGTVKVTATATDAAGNQRRATASYELVQQWVEGRAPGGPALQVKRGGAFTLYIRTTGDRPQLMLPEARSYRPGPAFRAITAKDGMVTWKLRYRVPKKLRASVGGWLGYRLTGEPVKTTERLPIRLVAGSTKR